MNELSFRSLFLRSLEVTGGMADTAQERAEEQERLRSVLMETVLLLCKSSLSYEHSLSVQGVIGITMDDQVMLVHVNEKVQEQAKEAGKRRKRTYVSTSEDDLVVVKQEIKDEPNDPTPTMSAQQSYATPHNDSVRVPDASSFTDSNDAASFQYDDPLEVSSLREGEAVQPLSKRPRCGESSDETGNSVEQAENVNTKRKTQSDLRLLAAYRAEVNYPNPDPIELLPTAELDELLCNFFQSLKKADGTDYEPNSLRGIQTSIMRYLRGKGYSHNIHDHLAFQGHRQVLKSMIKKLKENRLGVSKPKKTEPFTVSEVELLYEKEIFGADNPESIIATLWFIFKQQFRLHNRHEHYHLRWGDVQLRFTSSSDGSRLEYLEYERNASVRSGPPHEDSYAIQIFAHPGNPRCPVRLYKRYRDLRPLAMLDDSAPFYLNPLGKIQADSQTWYSLHRTGTNKLGEMARTIAKKAGLRGH
ncbi:hypothetical protein CAPTEDRAFT_221201 [Capitella teleta]|uniref:Uncharacterized protein n=1 Tax=Capitella teleta TaxID=283909 RepID=R7TS16_CAPTE|nr:hypothetical protein CAPTEDRAFT_221201 [Capitella teleta]|eukprot:ELT96439.1 hypothetical protein CAPTEDRAFT_221201 [Capitella teleta]